MGHIRKLGNKAQRIGGFYFLVVTLETRRRRSTTAVLDPQVVPRMILNTNVSPGRLLPAPSSTKLSTYDSAHPWNPGATRLYNVCAEYTPAGGVEEDYITTYVMSNPLALVRRRPDLYG